ncbi:MAG TPA: FliM/FliN family flagellar motor switch protein [Candidatus Acidoferrum sp.]|nr:FliM/FliN family flagellar motor switch protein [Candidatus Acidoferrum sp.]
MSDILSQNEIDALLHGVADDVEAAQLQTPEISKYELYDLTTGINRVQGWLHDIRLVDERIQSNLGASLLSLLHKSVDVRREEIMIQKFGEYSKTLYVPTSVNTFALTGLHGFSAIVLDAKLVYALVNVFFGGGTRPTQVEGREFTTTEQRVIRLVLKSIVEAIKLGWKALSDVEFRLVETEMNPAAISAYSATDVVVVRPFKVGFDGGGGEVQLLMPGSVIDSIFRHRGKSIDDAHNINILRQRSLRFLTTVTGELSGANLTIGELFKLSAGDIISVDSPEKVDMKINGVTKFKARMGEVNGKVGLKVLG